MKKFLGVFLLLLALPGVYFLFAFVAAQNTILTPTFVKNTLQSENAYRKLYNGIPEIISSIAGEDATATGRSALDAPWTKDEISVFSKKIISANEIAALSDSFWGSLLTWVSGKSDELKPIEIRFIKNRIDAEFRSLYRKRYNNLPVCSYLQLVSGEAGATCRVPGYSYDDILSSLEKKTGESQSITANLPNEFSLEAYANGNSELRSQYNNLIQVRSVIEVISWMLVVSSIFLAGLVILAARLFVRSWRKVYQSLGWTFVGFSLFGFALSKLLELRFAALMERGLVGIDSLPNLTDTLFIPLATSIRRGYFTEINKYFLASLVAGFSLVVVHYAFAFYERFNERKSGWSLKQK